MDTLSGLHVKDAQFQACSDGNWSEALEVLVESTRMRGDVYISLSEEKYNLLLIDAPDVPDNELSDAIRWRVKDLISQPIDSVVMDFFVLPEDAYRGRMKMIYVAVVDKSLVQSIVSVCDEHDLNIENISIHEVSLSNLLFASGMTEGEGTGLVSLGATSGQMRLVESGNLYLARNIDSGVDRLTGWNEEELTDYDLAQCDQVMFDIKRSLDYYESQLGKGAVNNVILMPADVNLLRLSSVLNEKMPVNVQPWLWPSAENITYEAACQDVMNQCTAAIGAVAGGWLEN
ncbi:hypothetical protein GCM10022277_27370 [Litoribacillus peritrichatus]|uniref:MSHA biogenesis protein MshI n=2 Tax=Litoribacillus peritrichatus TaxID=718191 RepID=A0ABP7MSG0_9GAMM